MKKRCILISILFILGGALFLTPLTVSATGHKDTLVVALNRDIGTLDAGSTRDMYCLTFLVYDSLIHLDRNFKQVPGLATSWSMSDDGKTWTFQLRKGVRFHDGTPFDAQAVKFTLERNKTSPIPKYGFHLIKNMEIPDSHTIIFHLTRPLYSFTSDLTTMFNAIRTPSAFDTQGKVIKAVGTGPYKMEKWIPNREIVLVSNEEYWDGRPLTKRLVFKIIPDPETQVMALEAGEIDMLFGESLAPAQLWNLEMNRDLKIVKKIGTNSSMIFFNALKPPFDDQRVRRAVFYAIDTKSVVEKLLKGVARPAEHVFSPAFDAFNSPDLAVSNFDPDRARKLLKEAGWVDADGDGILDKDAKPLRVSMVYDTNNTFYGLLANAFQAQLTAVGIDMRLQKVEFGVYYQLYSNKKFDMMLVGQWFIPHDEPLNYYKNYFSPKGFYNVASDPDIADLFTKLDLEVIREKRLQYHYALQKTIVDKALNVFVLHEINPWVMHKSVLGFEPYIEFWRQYKALEKAYLQ